MTDSTQTLHLSPAEVTAVRKALGIYTALAQGQLESVYWHLLHPGVLPQRRPDAQQRAPANHEQLQAIADLLDQIKQILGYPIDQCNAIAHPHTHDSVRLAHALELTLHEHRRQA